MSMTLIKTMQDYHMGYTYKVSDLSHYNYEQTMTVYSQRVRVKALLQVLYVKIIAGKRGERDNIA